VRRRDIIILLGGVTAGWPLAPRAQPPNRVARIGLMTLGSTQSGPVNAFFAGLREIGYVQGRNIAVEARSAGGEIERLPAVAAELVGLKVDVIVAPNTPTARAAQQATRTIPIVVAVMGDPVGDGLVANLARPGGNITGLTFLGPELLPKRLALLRDALPAVSRVAGLWHPRAYGERTMSEMMKETDGAARALGLQLRLVAAQSPDELDRAFATIAGERADALIVYPSPMLFAGARRIVDFATKHRLPTMAFDREFTDLGGFLSFGASIGDLFRRAAIYVDKILKGAKPSDLPVEQPTKFELVINLKTAKALGVTVPEALLARADDVIE
jgi:putative tryptophan/tyrosine transport system substrate-binding protein